MVSVHPGVVETAAMREQVGVPWYDWSYGSNASVVVLIGVLTNTAALIGGVMV